MRKLQLGLFGMMVFALLGVSGCGGNTPPSPDAKPPIGKQDTGVAPVQSACDPTDQSEEGISLCIINSAGGGGTVITRVPAVPVESCL